MNVNLYVIKDYENETAFGLRENKPNQTQFQTRSEAEIPTGELLGILKPGTNFKGKKMPRHGYFALILTHFTEQSIPNASF